MKIKSTLKGQEEAVAEFYGSCPEGMTVDHMVPLNNPIVCGLHVPWNFQYMSFPDNSSKGNKFDPSIYPYQGTCA